MDGTTWTETRYMPPAGLLKWLVAHARRGSRSARASAAWRETARHQLVKRPWEAAPSPPDKKIDNGTVPWSLRSARRATSEEAACGRLDKKPWCGALDWGCFRPKKRWCDALDCSADNKMYIKTTKTTAWLEFWSTKRSQVRIGVDFGVIWWVIRSFSSCIEIWEEICLTRKPAPVLGSWCYMKVAENRT